jgi:Arc/MetJ-type ribon-helix-helix transcriptional regulator
MSIGISPESEQSIQDLVARGEYHNRAAVLDEAVATIEKT